MDKAFLEARAQQYQQARANAAQLMDQSMRTIIECDAILRELAELTAAIDQPPEKPKKPSKAHA
ncbi:MAG: hypothetical protein BGO51_06170 [Rhodospirillales bacterium 69-11]|nr:MAG: hypothetical protein BGO51_06170 [Rhodospirillales bacterium 69-11]